MTASTTTDRDAEEVDYTAWLRINACHGDHAAAVKSLIRDRRSALSNYDFDDALLFLRAAELITRHDRPA